MTFYLPQKTQVLWQIRIVTVFAILGATVVFFSRYNIWFLLPAAIVVTIGLLICFIFIPFYFKSYKITVDENSIIITKGIIIKTSYIMPYPRLIFAQSFTTPLSSAMKLKSIVLKAARGRILIPEMKHIDAEHLLDTIRVKKNV